MMLNSWGWFGRRKERGLWLKLMEQSFTEYYLETSRK